MEANMSQCIESLEGRVLLCTGTVDTSVVAPVADAPLAALVAGGQRVATSLVGTYTGKAQLTGKPKYTMKLVITSYNHTTGAFKGTETIASATGPHTSSVKGTYHASTGKLTATVTGAGGTARL